MKVQLSLTLPQKSNYTIDHLLQTKYTAQSKNLKYGSCEWNKYLQRKGYLS